MTVFAGRVDRTTYLVALITAGWLTGGCISLLDYRMKWLAPMLVGPALFAAQTVFTKPRSIAEWLTDGVIVLVTVLGAPYVQKPWVRVYDRISITPEAILIVWTLAAGVLAAQWVQRKTIDRRLHIADRFATRQWAIRPALPRS